MEQVERNFGLLHLLHHSTPKGVVVVVERGGDRRAVLPRWSKKSLQKSEPAGSPAIKLKGYDMTTIQPKASRHRGEPNAEMDFSHLKGADFTGVQRVAAEAVARHEAERGARRLGRAMQAELSKPRAGYRSAF